MVAHFALVSGLGGRAAAPRLARDGGGWKLVVVAGDRSFLFSRIAGCLSFFGADIVSAEAFSNSQALILDTFSIADAEGRFEQPEEGRRFQAFLESVITGEVDLERELGRGGPVRATLALEWDDAPHPEATRLIVSGPDARACSTPSPARISDAGCGIEIAHVETAAGRIRDTFFLTSGAGSWPRSDRRAVEQSLAALDGRRLLPALDPARGHE